MIIKKLTTFFNDFHNRANKANKEKGMSLIEIIIVIALLGTLMTIIISNLTGRQEEAMKDAARLGMQQLSQTLEMYKIHNYKYPTSDQGLDALISAPSGGNGRWRGPYTEEKKLNDPWGQKYEYESDGRKFTIISGGPDQEVGNGDDVKYPDDSEATDGDGTEE